MLKVLLVLLGVLSLVTASTPLRPPVLNIGWWDYYAALSKWNSRHVTDYEETFSAGDLGQWKIVVYVDRSTGSPAECLMHFERLDGVATSNVDAILLKYWAVDSMFHGVDQLLRNPNGHVISEGGDFCINLQFDPAMGYPRALTSIGYPRYATSMDDYAYTSLLSVESIKVLK